MANPAPQGRFDVKDIQEKVSQDIVFVIERNIDDDVVVYEAVLSADKTKLVGFKIWWTKLGNYAHHEEVSDRAKAIFYDVEIQPVKRGVYRVLLKCLKNDTDTPMDPYFIDIHIKKSGRCVAKSIVAGKECTLRKIYADLTKLPPTINGMWVHGTFNDAPVCEKIAINPNLIDRVDISSFMPSMGI